MPHSASRDAVVLPGGTLRAVLARVVRRTAVRHVLFGTSAFMIVLAIARAAAFTAGGVALGVVAAAAVLWRGRSQRTACAAAMRVDHAADCHNVVITAEELIRHPERTAGWVRRRVLTDADAAVQAAPIAAIAPLLLPAVWLAVSLGLLITAWIGMGHRTSQAVRAAVSALNNAGTVAASAPLQIVVTVTPPAYVGQPAREVRDPERIEAIEGSVLQIAVSGGANGWRVRSAAGPLAASNTGSQTLVETRAVQSGYLAVEPDGGHGDGRHRRDDRPARSLGIPACRRPRASRTRAGGARARSTQRDSRATLSRAVCLPRTRIARRCQTPSCTESPVPQLQSRRSQRLRPPESASRLPGRDRDPGR
jgi:hypothetical protein